MCKIVIVVVAALALFSGHALAQNPQTPQWCNVSTSLIWNNTDFFGNWMEVGRNPIQGTPGCMIFYGNLTSDNVTLSINGSRSANPTSVYGTIHESAKVKLVANATTGYNVTFNNGAPVMTKLLQFVNYTYLIGCGYTDNQDMSTSFGFILARSNYTLDNTQIAANNASKLYSNFQNSSTFGTINQKGCIYSSASQSLPMISGFVALALLLIKAH